MKFKQIIFLLATLITFTATTVWAQSTGSATYYGNNFHGRRTSDGSRYHKDSLTCAHRTLPFGTLLKVRNTKNGKEVVVKVTDRGPFRKGGIVDLSMAAAKEIGMVAQGVARVEVTEVGHSDKSNAPIYDQMGEAYADNVLPEAQYLDPATGQFYTLDEWRERGLKAQQQRMAAAKKKLQPNYRILNAKLMAKQGAIKKHK